MIYALSIAFGIVGVAAVFADELPRRKDLSGDMFIVLRILLVVVSVTMIPKDILDVAVFVATSSSVWGPAVLLYLVAVSPFLWKRST